MDQHCIMWFGYISEQYRHLLSWILIIVGETGNTQLTCKLIKQYVRKGSLLWKKFYRSGKGDQEVVEEKAGSSSK